MKTQFNFSREMELSMVVNLKNIDRREKKMIKKCNQRNRLGKYLLSNSSVFWICKIRNSTSLIAMKIYLDR